MGYVRAAASAGQADQLGTYRRHPAPHPTIGDAEHPPDTTNLREGKE